MQYREAIMKRIPKIVKIFFIILIGLILISLFFSNIPELYAISPLGKYSLPADFQNITEAVSISAFEKENGNISDFFDNLSKEEEKNIKNQSDKYIIANLKLIITNPYDFEVTYLKFNKINNFKVLNSDIVFWSDCNWLINKGFPIETTLKKNQSYPIEVKVLLLKSDFENIQANGDSVELVSDIKATKLIDF